MAFTGIGLDAPSIPVDTGVDNADYTARRSRNEMSDEDFAVAVVSAQRNSVDYIDGFVAPERARALCAYKGDNFGSEEGRSSIVLTEVRDTVLAMMPAQMRIFTSSDQIVQFAANNAETVELAEQQTDYINHVFYNDNPGFEILYNAIRDALVSKIGIIKWRWSEDTTITAADFTALTEGALAILKSDPDVTITKIRGRTADGSDDMSGQLPETVYDVSIKRSKSKDRVVIEALPPEEFLIARDARDIYTASYVGHRAMKTRSDLIAMGYDPEDIDENDGGGEAFIMNYEAQARNPAINTFTQQERDDPSMRVILYVENYIRIDRDGDGIAELHRACTIGNKVVHDEIIDEAPFALFCAVPEPHMAIGESVADQTMDLQLIKSNILRGTLDSLALSVTPRSWMVEGQVNSDDMMNTEIGSIIRMRQVGMAGEFNTTFVGQASLPILSYMDQVGSKRTGVSPASAGLDPDVLQSTTKAGVDATVNGAQERNELIARLLAESGMKHLFKGLLKMVVRHQDKPRTVRLTGKWIEVDPRYWDADLDVMVNVALGRGTDAEQTQFFMMVAQQQSAVIQQVGPVNPLCGVDKLRATYAKILNLQGVKDTTTYFNEINMEQLQQQMAQQTKPPDPTTMLAQIEAQKVQLQGQKNQVDAAQKQAQMAQDAQLKRDEMESQAAIKREQMTMENQTKQEQMRLDAMIRLAEIEAKYQTQIDTAHIESIISHDEAIATGQQQAEVTKHGNLASALSNVLGEHIKANAPQPQSQAGNA